MLFNKLLTQYAHKHPAKAAVITNEATITYRELEDAANGMAHHLAGRGLRPGDRVAVHWQNSVEFVVLLLGGWRAGLIIVPINTRLKTPEITYILKHSGARLCFSQPELAPLVEDFEVCSQLPAPAGTNEPLPDVSPDAPAIILYTSGTTAQPKGVVHSQRSLFEGARVVMDQVRGSGDRPLATSQMAHMTGLQVVYLQGLIQGASVVLLKAFGPTAALDAIERYGCTYVLSLPACLQQIAEQQAEHPRNVSSLQGILAGGDSVPAALQRRCLESFHVEVQEACGMTEVCPTTFNPREAIRSGSIGLPVASIRIVDANGNDMGPGGIGEMIVRSPANCIGYWNDPEATARLFEGGWLHTGDLASRDDDGYLWFKGRLKQIIILGGSNISPQEVEEALYQHPAVLEAGVVGQPDPIFGEIVVAFISLRERRQARQDELIAHARTLLADYKTPEQILFMQEELPKGLTGKIDRRRLREILLADADLVENNVISRV